MEVYTDFQIRARKRARAKKNRVEFHCSRCLSRLFGTSLSLCFVDPLGLPENRSSFGTGVLTKFSQTKKGALSYSFYLLTH